MTDWFEVLAILPFANLAWILLALFPEVVPMSTWPLELMRSLSEPPVVNAIVSAAGKEVNVFVSDPYIHVGTLV